ncbi:MAG: CvpA family protein [Pseudomonadota bacterium]
MNFAILDGVVIAVVFLSAILAMFRGFVREILSIAAWVAAALLAYLFYEQLVPFVSQYVDNPTIAIGLSAAAIFLVSLIVVSLITMKISDFVMDSPIGALDRFLGFLFGAARGLLLVVVAVIFFNWLVDEENRPAWVTTAMTYPELSQLGEQLLDAIPDDPEAAIRGAFEEEAPERVNQPGDTGVEQNNREGLNQLIDGATGNNDGTSTIAPGGQN